MMRRLAVWSMAIVAVVTTGVWATDVPVASQKLLLRVKFKDFIAYETVEYAAKDPGVTKGPGVDPDHISVRFLVAYGAWYGKGQWTVPSGDGWLTNDAAHATYFDPASAEFYLVKRLAIRPGRSLKLTATGFGDASRDIDPANVGAPHGPVYTAYCVTNGGEENCHCSAFPTCTWVTWANGNSGKLVCRHGVGDPSCRAKCSDLVDQGATLRDGCSGLEWEKKETVVGSGADAANPRDVDNLYTWAGQCSLDTTVLCQPTAAAAALCAAQTGGALGCGECGVGQGVCDVALGGAVTTVWDWLDGLNTAAFGGHTDWRLPTGGSGLYEWATMPSELGSLADHVCAFTWCTGTALGPVAPTGHWTATSSVFDDRFVIGTTFGGGPSVDLSFVPFGAKASAAAVRAVRSAP